MVGRKTIPHPAQSRPRWAQAHMTVTQVQMLNHKNLSSGHDTAILF